MPDLQSLINDVSNGIEPEYLFFWGHRPSKTGEISASCLSQWWAAPIEVNGVRYATAEHWMMAGKARAFNDEIMLEKILATDDPGKAKHFGSLVTNFDSTVWDQRRIDIVIQGNLHKFGQHPRLLKFLLRSTPRVLVEASPMDRVWGVGLSAGDPEIMDPRKWRGTNLLGFALMEVRERLQTT